MGKSLENHPRMGNFNPFSKLSCSKIVENCGGQGIIGNPSPKPQADSKDHGYVVLRTRDITNGSNFDGSHLNFDPNLWLALEFINSYTPQGQIFWLPRKSCQGQGGQGAAIQIGQSTRLAQRILFEALFRRLRPLQVLLQGNRSESFAWTFCILIHFHSPIGVAFFF